MMAIQVVEPMRHKRIAGGVGNRSEFSTGAWCVLALLWSLVAFWPGLASASERLEISQVRQLQSGGTRVRVYADLQDSDGGASGSLKMEDVAATLGQETAVVSGVRAFPDSQEGVGFIFLVDISLSINEEHFEQIRTALDGWISRLRPQDRAALISVGSQSRLVMDWTNDFAELRRNLGDLGPSDRDTLLNKALVDALDLGERRDPDLPGRRVVTVLTDGRDEGSERALDDVLEEIRRRPLPVYAIGFSQLQGAQRVTYFDVLRRLASNSGGAFFEAERTEFAEAYERIAEAVHRVWVIDLDCPGCIPDGRALRLQLSVRSENRVLSRGTDLRLLPQASLPTRRTTPAAASSSDPTSAAAPGGATSTAPADLGAELPTGGAAAAGDVDSPVAGSAEDRAVAEGGAPPSEDGSAAQTQNRAAGSRGPLLLWLGLIALMIGLIVVGLLARRAASNSEETAEMVRSELSKALGGHAAREESGHPTTADGEDLADASASAISAAAAAPTGAAQSSSSGSLDREAIEKVAAKAAASVERARHREELVERALLDHAQRRRTGQAQALFVPRTIRLVTVRGAQKGKQYRGIVRGSLTVGGRSTNDVVLLDEPTAPAELFEIFQDDYQVQMRAGDQQIVLCNGLPPEFGQELRSGDLIGTQDLIYRLVLDE